MKSWGLPLSVLGLITVGTFVLSGEPLVSNSAPEQDSFAGEESPLIVFDADSLLSEQVPQRDQGINVVSLQRWPVGNPWFSPDGSRFFALTRDGLAVGQADGSEARILEPNAVHAQWAPDSRSIAVAVAEGPKAPLIEEGEIIPVYLMEIDRSSRRQLGTTDSPYHFEFLESGEIALSLGSELRLVDAATESASLVEEAALDSGPLNDVPFRVSSGGEDVAELTGTTLSVVDRGSGGVIELTSNIHPRRWSPYSWSPDGRSLAYADLTDDGLPQLVMFDRDANEKTVLLVAGERGMYSGVSFTPNGEWLIFAFRPKGTGAETEARYEAINPLTGEHVTLFETGASLRLSPDGTRITFVRTIGDPAEIGAWVATLSYE